MTTSRPERAAVSTVGETGLSLAERARMRAALREYIALRPIGVPSHDVAIGWRSIFSMPGLLVYRPAVALLAALVVVGLSAGGVVYAAEGSLPGDPLYTIKTEVTEPLATALAVTPAAQRDWQETLARRRLDEAATLSSQGRLGTTTELALTAAFVEHANAVTQLATSTAAGEQPSLDETFSAQLKAYQSVLAQTGAGEQGATTTALLQDAVRQQVALADSSVKNPFLTRATTTARAAQTLQVAARAALDTSRALVHAATPTLSATTSRSAQGALGKVQSLAVKGNTLLAQKDSQGAARAFQDSLSESARLDVLTHAAATLHIDPFATSSATSSASTATSTATSTAPRVEKRGINKHRITK